MREPLLSVIKDLIARAGEAPLPVIALTDEEIAALDGDLAQRGPVPLPWLDGKDKAARELACQVALRGLAARRLVIPLGPEGDTAAEGGEVGRGAEGGDVGRGYIALRDDLRAVLAMRRSAHAAVFALRESDGRMRLLYLGTSGALEEAISPGGLHGFTVVARAAAAERLAAFADPEDAAVAALQPGRESEPRVLPLAEIARGAEIPAMAGVRSVTMVTRLVFGADAGEQRATVYAKEAGVVVACPADASGAPALRFAEVSRSGLRECLAGLLSIQEPVASSGDQS
ncbi:MAG: hypothetical protein ACRDNO_30855 [Trebonia sp.]